MYVWVQVCVCVCNSEYEYDLLEIKGGISWEHLLFLRPSILQPTSHSQAPFTHVRVTHKGITLTLSKIYGFWIVSGRRELFSCPPPNLKLVATAPLFNEPGVAEPFVFSLYFKEPKVLSANWSQIFSTDYTCLHICWRSVFHGHILKESVVPFADITNLYNDIG